MKLLSFYFPLLFALLFLSGCGTKSNEVTINGRLSGVEDGAILSLLPPSDEGASMPFVSDTIRNGRFHFSFTDSVAGAKAVRLVASGEGYVAAILTLWVEPGAEIEITGNDKLLQTWDIKSKVKEQQEQNKYTARNKEFIIQTQEIMREVYPLFDMMRNSPEQAGELRKRIDPLYKRTDSLRTIIRNNEIEMMKENPTISLFWIDLLYAHSRNLRYDDSYPHKEELLALYSLLPEEEKKSEKGESITLNLFPPKIVKEGDEMADTDLYDLEGNLHHLADYKGKYILLDFWSAGCGPCIMSMPEMAEIAESYKDKLTVVSISSDNKEIWEMVSKEKNITWVNLNDFKGNNGLEMNYGVKSIPNYVLISPEGKVLSIWMGYARNSLKNKMKELIK